MDKPIRNMGESVRARLLTISRERGQPFELLLTRFALERLLYRISQTGHRERFVLKGAMLMTSWFDDPYRPTRDLDLLGYGESSPEAMLLAFREILAISNDDGLNFDASALRADPIREATAYGGLRLRTTATLAGARIPVLVDIGFGDAVEPAPEEIELPVLLDFPAPRLRAYARETVIAEKFHAMTEFGHANSRMKDYYDVWLLAQTHRFDDDRLAQAISATFARRGTVIPQEIPDALSKEFSAAATRRQQWAAFAQDLAASLPAFETVIGDLAAFLMPVARLAQQRNSPRG